MGANKTDKAIEMASRAVGGSKQIVENFDYMVCRHGHSSLHSHASSIKDEGIYNNLRILKPFSIKRKRKHTSFGNIRSDPVESLDRKKIDEWLQNHKKNLVLDPPMDDEDEEDIDEEEFYEHEFDEDY